jgi:hypothetical protein
MLRLTRITVVLVLEYVVNLLFELGVDSLGVDSTPNSN